MKHLIIIGAGGMGRGVYWIAKGCCGYGETFDIKGLTYNNAGNVQVEVRCSKVSVDS